jgi:hypothetical protein
MYHSSLRSLAMTMRSNQPTLGEFLSTLKGGGAV